MKNDSFFSHLLCSRVKLSAFSVHIVCGVSHLLQPTICMLAFLHAGGSVPVTAADCSSRCSSLFFCRTEGLVAGEAHLTVIHFKVIR